MSTSSSSLPSSSRASLVHPFSLTVDRSRTKEFRALVQSLSLKRKRPPSPYDDDEKQSDPSPPPPPPSILPPPPPPSSRFTLSALHLRRAISDLHRLLLTQQRAYLNVHRFLSSASPMTEAERDQLETTVASAAVECAAKIEELKGKEDEEEEEGEGGEGEEGLGGGGEVGDDLRRHRECLVLSLYDALRAVTAVLQGMKEQRRRQQREEAETLHPVRFRDEAEYRRRKGLAPQAAPDSAERKEEEEGGEQLRKPAPDAAALQQPTTKWARLAAATQPRPVSPSSPSSSSSSSASAADGSQLASPELVQENAELLSSLSSDLDAMKVAESKASEVAQLLSLFHSKVLQQSEQIDRIEDATITSTAFVERGVDQLRKAASKGASFRLMVLFMILTLSFSLLFLDYLYD